MSEVVAVAKPELPFAIVDGQAFMAAPQDLYIPPHALEVFLEAFEGPLDLLLYLIKRQNLDILEIPIAEITRQYVEYIEVMTQMRLELAAEYLVMAAVLAEIKSRMLLPRSSSEEQDEEDPRAQLIRRLQEYECFKLAAQSLDELPRLNRDVFSASTEAPDMELTKPLPQVDMRELMLAFNDVMKRAQLNASHEISREPLSVRERMSQILSSLTEHSSLRFESLFKPEEGRRGVVVTFVALLELVKQSLITLIQAQPYGPIHLSGVSS